MKKVAALYVMKEGAYSDLSFVDAWPESRDARLYDGPYPVVSHPPCERWGRYWGGGPMLHGTPKQKKLGDDGGCFERALEAVRRWGGIIEHPEASHAWSHFGLNKPPRMGGWVSAGDCGGLTCCVEQGQYGHPARKATWLYAFGVQTPELRWGKSAESFMRLDQGYHSTEQRRLNPKPKSRRLSRLERLSTPPEFRDLLISIALTASQ